MTRLCRLFAVTRAGFYAWRRRPVSARRRQDRDLLEDVRAIFEAQWRDLRQSADPAGAAGAVAIGSVAGGSPDSCARTASGARVARVYRGKAGVASLVQSTAESRAPDARDATRIRSGSAT